MTGQGTSALDRYEPSRRVIVFQPALPSYRINLFERLAQRFGDRFSVCYAESNLGVLTASPPAADWAHQLPPIYRLAVGLEWQPGVLATPVRRGDVVVVSGAPRNLSNMLMLVWARLKGARTIWWGQFWSATSRRRNLPLRMLLMRLADAVILYTDKEVEAYRAGPGRSDRRPVTALNNGINVDPILALRRPFKPAERDKAILFIGRLTSKAGLSLVLRALSDSRLADITLHVIGDGDDLSALKSLAAQVGVSERVVWHGGITSESSIAAIANSCRLFVYPGSVGLSLIHAMAYGLPAIVHDDPRRHMPEIAAFEDGRTGVAFTANDVGSLASAIDQIIISNELLLTASAAASVATETTFNTSFMTERFVSIIDKVSKY